MGDWGGAVSLKGYPVLDCPDRFLAWSSSFQTLKIFSAQAVQGTIPVDLFGDITVDLGTDTFTCAAHGLINGNTVTIDGFEFPPGGITWGLIYYVINKTTNTFQVSRTPGGSAVNITSASSDFMYFYTNRNVITITHNLGRLVPYIVIYNSGSNNYFFSDSGISQLETRCFTDRIEIGIDGYFDGADGTGGGTVNFTVYIFLDGFDTIAGSSIDTDTPGAGASSADYGIAVSKDGYNVLTCTSEQLAFSSSFFNQIVHMKGIATTLPVAHSLGYAPQHLTYLKPTSESFIKMDPYFGTTTTNLDVGYTLSDYGVAYYVVFKNNT